MQVVCLFASAFCAVFAALLFYVANAVLFGFLLAALALLFACAAISKDGTVRRVLLWFISRMGGH